LKISDTDYQPDVFEYDDEQDYGEEGEKVILDENHDQRDIRKTIGRRKMGTAMIRNFEDDEDQMI